MFVVGLCTVFIVAPGILLVQAFLWLRDGSWMPLSLSNLLYWARWDLPEVNWLGLQKLIDWLLRSPLSLVALVTGVAILWLGTYSPRKK